MFVFCHSYKLVLLHLPSYELNVPLGQDPLLAQWSFNRALWVGGHEGRTLWMLKAFGHLNLTLSAHAVLCWWELFLMLKSIYKMCHMNVEEDLVRNVALCYCVILQGFVFLLYIMHPVCFNPDDNKLVNSEGISAGIYHAYSIKAFPVRQSRKSP